MTEVIIQNEPEDYYDVFSSSLFNGKLKRELNWLEKSEREQNKREREMNLSKKKYQGDSNE